MPSRGSHELVIKGRLVLGDRVLDGGTIGVDGGRIAAIYSADAEPTGDEVRDYSGRYVMPGIVDSHVHMCSFETESIATATASAAAGGVTTLVDMPYDRGKPVMGVERLREKIDEVEAAAIVDVGLYGTMPKHDGVGVLADLVDAGVCAFKFSLYEYDAERFPRIADGDLVEAFERLSDSGVPVVLHNELQEVVDHRTSQLIDQRTENDPLLHGQTHPVVAETAASVKALDFAYWTGARLHLAHCTHPHTFRLIESYRALGADVSGETCAHYLMLTEADVAKLGPIAKVNPPIRDAVAHEGLWDALEAGRVASISSDHAPWALELKQRSMFRASAGIPGLETLLTGVVSAGRKRGMPLPELLGYLTWRPAELFGLGRKGRLEVGFDADVAVFDARSKWTFRAEELHSKAKWSPVDGRVFDGRVEATFVRGRLVYEDGQVRDDPGSGRWLRRRN